MNGDDFVCLSHEDGLNHIDSLLKSKHSKRHEGAGIRRFGCEASSVVETCFQGWDRSNSTILGNRTSRYVWVQEPTQDGDLSVKKSPTATNWSWNEACLCFRTAAA